MYNAVTNDADMAAENLQSKINLENWKELAEATLVLIILFNKRRAGEASRIKKDQFEKALEKTEVNASMTTVVFLLLPCLLKPGFGRALHSIERK